MRRYVCEHVGRQQTRVWSKQQRTSPKVHVSASGATTPTSWCCCIVPKLSESRSSFHTLQTAAITRWWTHKCSVTFKTIGQSRAEPPQTPPARPRTPEGRQTGGASWRRKDGGRGAPVFREDLLPRPYVGVQTHILPVRTKPEPTGYRRRCSVTVAVQNGSNTTWKH